MNITLVYQKLPLNVKTLVRENEDGAYTILINPSFNCKQQKEAVLHDLTHIARNDFTREEHANLIEQMVHSAANISSDTYMEFHCR